MIKKTAALLFIATMAIPALLRAQNPPPVTPRLEDDPGFKRLSPDAQEWVRAMMDRLHRAIEQHDIKAIDQIQLDLARHQLKGLELCGHTVDEGTLVDARVSNSGGDEAFAIRWLDPTPGSLIRTAIFTGRKRCVVADGDTVDSKYITRAMANSLAVSRNHSLTAWEGEYWETPSEKLAGGSPHRGVFIENRLAFELDATKASNPDSLPAKDDPDFRWDDERETLIPKAGVVKGASTKSSKPTSQTAPTTPPKRRALPTIPCLPFQTCTQGKP